MYKKAIGNLIELYLSENYPKTQDGKYVVQVFLNEHFNNVEIVSDDDIDCLLYDIAYEISDDVLKFLDDELTKGEKIGLLDTIRHIISDEKILYFHIWNE